MSIYSRRIILGLGAISQIFGILSEITLGYQFIQIGLIMRESILSNKILLSSESWHRLFKYQIEKLEDLGSTFYRKLYNGHAETSLEYYISESGTVPIRFLISSRRLMYWWHIVHANQSERIQRVYKAQKLSPVPGDWIELLEKDKRAFQVNLSDEELLTVSEEKFKKYVKNKAKELTIEYLTSLQAKH
jgi:hypothetical protein